MRGKKQSEETLSSQILRSIFRELAPNLVALIILLVIAQFFFFIWGRDILITNISKSGLFLLNFVFAIIVPYNLAMVVKAIKLIVGEVKKRK